MISQHPSTSHFLVTTHNLPLNLCVSSDAPRPLVRPPDLSDHDEDPRVASLIQRAALGATLAAEALQWPEDVLDLVSCNNCGWMTGGETW